jgi:hypothetical protein
LDWAEADVPIVTELLKLWSMTLTICMAV